MRPVFRGLWQSIASFVNQWTTLVAVACAAFAIMQELSQRAILPTWAWWSAALVLMSSSGVKARWDFLREQDKQRVRQPDRELSSVVEDILGIQDPEALGASTRVSQLFTEMREKASTGLISVWGRKNAKPTHLSFHPLEPVPQSHWSLAHVDFVAFLKDPRCATQDARYPGNSDHYSDLHFDSVEIKSQFARRER